MSIPGNQLLTLSLGTIALWLAALCYFLFRTNKNLAQQLTMARENEVLAFHDFLTGLLNRRGWDRVVRETLANSDRGMLVGPGSTCHLTLVLMDLDQFKQINDLYGHSTGDRVLQAFAKRLVESFAESTLESPARIGGEEFALFSHQSDDALIGPLQKFVESLQRTPLIVDQESIGIGCSVGIAQRNESETFEHWLGRADQALYDAKRSGGNHVELAKDP
ncbi:MAG: GGDEF domain-containing protein [Pirellula sp.]